MKCYASIIKTAKSCNITQYSDSDPFIENVKNSILKFILKYKKQPSILAIQTEYNRNAVFSFSEVSLQKQSLGGVL